MGLRNERIVLSTEMNEKVSYVLLLSECFDIFICKRQQKPNEENIELSSDKNKIEFSHHGLRE